MIEWLTQTTVQLWAALLFCIIPAAASIWVAKINKAKDIRHINKKWVAANNLDKIDAIVKNPNEFNKYNSRGQRLLLEAQRERHKKQNEEQADLDKKFSKLVDEKKNQLEEALNSSECYRYNEELKIKILSFYFEQIQYLESEEEPLRCLLAIEISNTILHEINTNALDVYDIAYGLSSCIEVREKIVRLKYYLET